jgi:DNA-binding CsgD family transcriptional regulator
MTKFVPEENNVLYSAESEIKQICQPIIELLDLQYYSYGRFYDDGKCVLLSTNKDVFINHFKKEYQLTVAPKEEKKTRKKIYNLILIEDTLPDIIADEYNLFGHGVMMDLIKKHPGYYEMFCFVAKKDAIDPTNKFINSRDSLDQFSEYFLNSAKSAIQLGEKNIIELPSSMKPLINGAPEGKKDDSYSIFHNGKSIALTARQIHCLALLTVGKTTKEIAKDLNISAKTVEDHITALKIKLTCNRKYELCHTGAQNNLAELAFSVTKPEKIES